MKELSIEEKAARYDEAIETARKINSGDGVPAPPDWTTCEVIFPELKEDEDEIVRKWIKKELESKYVVDNIVNNAMADKALAWLERRCEKGINGNDREITFSEQILANSTKTCKDGQKPNYCHHEVDLSECSEEYRKAYYDGWNNCNQQHAQLEAEQKPAWSEEDEEKKELKKIENEIEIPFGAKDSELQEVTYYIPKGFHAEIDDDKVVIKKGGKPTCWSEEDEMFVHGLIRGLTAKKDIHGHTTFSSDCIDITETIHWLESLKNRVLLCPVSIKYNEEDIDNIADTFIPEPVWNALEESEGEGSNAAAYDYSQMIAMFKAGVHWLKSLKERHTWKPSDEQIQALEFVVKYHFFADQDIKEKIVALLNVLKKLKKLKL